MGTKTNTCVPMFMEALFIITQRQEQPKCSLMDDGILKNMMCTHYGILFNHKKERSWDTCDKIDEPWKHAK